MSSFTRFQINAHVSQIKIFTTADAGAHTAFVHRINKNIKVSCGSFKGFRLSGIWFHPCAAWRLNAFAAVTSPVSFLGVWF